MKKTLGDLRSSFDDGLQQEPDGVPQMHPIAELNARLSQRGVPEVLRKALLASVLRNGEPAYVSFVEDVVYRGGLSWRKVNAADAGYRLLRPDGTLLNDLSYSSQVEELDGVTVGELIQPMLALDIPMLAGAVWATGSLAALRMLMRNLGAALRYSSDLKGRIQGLVVPGPTIAVLIEQIEAADYLSNIELRAHENLPDLLGLRRKVMQLDQERHNSTLAQQSEHGRYDPRRLLGWLRR